jgi:hypothetical protein
MPLYEVTLEQRCVEQQVINRWNYLGSGTPAAVTPSFGLAAAFGIPASGTTLTNGTVLGEMQDLQSPAVIFVQLIVRAVFIDDDFYTAPFAGSTFGENGDPLLTLSPTAAYGFRSNRVKQSIGRAYKRIVGVEESMQGSGGVLSAGAITLGESLGAAMGATLTYDDEGNTLTFVPCVVQKLKYTTPSGKSAYKYYPTESAQATHIASGINWELYRQTRTQTSRQYGRGS